MKKTYLFLAGAFALLGLIIAFENILMTAPVIILFTQLNTALFLPLFIMLLIGICTGLFLGLFMSTKKGGEDEADF